jgi:rhodanese-related sulfurtransferase
MELRKLFTPVAALDAEQARRFLAERPEGTYTLLDVRQPWEYEESHLPGAKLMPLAELPGRTGELDPAKPILAYCAVGGRSRVAAQLLSGMGFQEVYNLSGGIKAYQGAKASGPAELTLELVRGDESPREALALAYGMEKALQIFYERLREQAAEPELALFFQKMGHWEETHQQRLWERYQALAPEADRAAFAAGVSTEIMEGGFRLQDFLDRNAAFLTDLPHALELAMMVETQALDLYLRLAGRCREAGTKQVLFAVADEEKAHLAALARLWEEKAG